MYTEAFMDRLQIYLDSDLNRRLDALVYRLKTSKASLIRDGVRMLLNERATLNEEPLMGLKKLAGRSGRKDVSQRHDAYLAGLRRSRGS